MTKCIWDTITVMMTAFFAGLLVFFIVNLIRNIYLAFYEVIKWIHGDND